MFRLTLNRVRDSIAVRESNEEIKLKVDADPRIMVTRIREAQKLLNSANDPQTTDQQRQEAVKAFSEAIFGPEQAEALAEFYNGDYSCVLTICGMYFEKRLCKKIIAAQKKQR